MGSGLFLGWGWLALVGAIILLGLLLVPWFFFLLTLQALLGNIDPANRRMSPGKVWLNFIPVFQLGWFIYTVIKIRQSLEAEFQAREWFIDGDLGYNVGLTAGILWIASFVIGWIPFFGWMLALGGIICWIIYWLRASDFKNRLDAGPAWSSARHHAMYGPGYSPYEVRYPHDYGRRPAAGAPGAPEGALAAQPADGIAEASAPAEGEAADNGVEAADGGERRGKQRRSRERRRRSRRKDDNAAGEQPPAEPEDMRCKQCGAEYEQGDRYCRRCGSGLF